MKAANKKFVTFGLAGCFVLAFLNYGVYRARHAMREWSRSAHRITEWTKADEARVIEASHHGTLHLLMREYDK